LGSGEGSVRVVVVVDDLW